MNKDKLIELEHKLKMEELVFERETSRRIHEWRLEEGRIKNAEIKKNIIRKQHYEDMKHDGFRN